MKGSKATPLELEIRQALEEDSGAIAAILRESFAQYEAQYTARAYKATVSSPNEVTLRMAEGPLWLASLDQVPVGTASAVVKVGGCYIRGMAVSPRARGRRIGWTLLQVVEDFARRASLPLLFLETTPFLTPAIELYRRFGFRRTASERRELLGTPLFTMAKELLD